MALTEARQRALWLALPLALAVAPHLLRLPLWFAALWVLSFGLFLSVRFNRPGRAAGLLRLALAGAGLAGILAEFGTLFGPRGGVALLVLLTALKLQEARGPRDQFILIYLGYFLLMLNFLESQHPGLAVYLFTVSTALTAALITRQQARLPSPAHVFRVASTLTMQALPVALLLFLVFPRLPAALGGLIQAGPAQSGLSDDMQPGAISELILSNAVAFRVDFDNPGTDASRLYWRGPVFTHFDGQAWTAAAESASATPPELDRLATPLDYRVTLEPHGRHWLFVAGHSSTAPVPGARLSADLQWLSPRPVSERLGYHLRVWQDYQLDPDELSATRRAAALALPDGLNPRSRNLAQTWLRQANTPGQVVELALAHLRESPFFYTLKPPPLGRNGVDDFLFESQRGFCEHYANAFAVLMRMAGIPARVVTGYQGGERNPLGDYWIVRQRDAHAWVEVWLSGRGWVAVDPTAAVAPERVESGLDAALPSGERPMAFDWPWLRPLQHGWDLFNLRWYQWVLGFDPARQRDLLSMLHPALASLRGMLWAVVLTGLGSLILMGLLVLRPWRRPARAAAVRHYARVCAKLARIGLVRTAQEGPRAFAERVRVARPDLAVEVDALTALYIGQRYDRADTKSLRQLAARSRRFRPG